MMNSVNSRDSKVKLSIFFDGSCQLCNAEINYYRSRDKTQCFEFLDVSCKRTELPRILTRQRALERFHVLKNDQTLLSGTAAFAEVWKNLNGWKWVAYVVVIPGISTIMDMLYRFFLKHRKFLVWLFTKYNIWRTHSQKHER